MDSVNIVLLIFTGIGIVLAVGGGYAMYRAHDSRDWPVAPGEIMRSEIIHTRDSRGHIKYYPEVEYAYRVGRRIYQADRVQFGFKTTHSRQSTQQLVAKYPEGERVRVHYDPQNPQDSALEVGQTDRGRSLLFTGVFFAVLSAVMWLVFQFLA